MRFVGGLTMLLLLSLPAGAIRAEEPLHWLTDYGEAMRTAKRERKMVFFFFHRRPEEESRKKFETETLADPEVVRVLGELVVAKLPVGAKIKLNGQPVGVLEHPAFEPMLGRPGIAIVDLASVDAPYYGHLVTAYPFQPGEFCDAALLRTVLSLPAGTITQRTMILAVRIHPEHPGGAAGRFDSLLAAEAEKHSRYQAQIRVQGHHQWDQRFREITAQLPRDRVAQEVVAESWPGETLVEAAVECVYSWRRSPGHWSAVRERHGLFGFDMKRGTNGIWYATGLFGQRRE